MRVGFFFWPYTPEYTARMARLGEALGFDLVGIADTPGNALDPWVAMTIAAGATSRVRLATCVTNLVTRHPAITASAAASVDAAAGERTILGIGAGHSGVANVGGAPTRAAELGEGITFLKTALAGAPASWRGATTHLPWVKRPVPVYAAASGPAALRAVGATADGAFVNYGLGAAETRRVRSLIGEGAAAAGRAAGAVDVWSIACLDVAERREDALAKLGNILGFVAAYILGPDPEGRGVPPALVPAVRALRQTYTTRQHEMDAALTRRLGLFDYLRGRLAVAGTPDECLAQVQAAEAAGVSQLMFTVSLASDPVRTVELFGRAVLPRLRA
ncbi:MAG TPA: LLM class flavin-dependent oxidoreductase [Methylomirabilota bacterium]|nr:LLM class flavin-dependent oxidoreductase [Methylomirabilota bacterium]